MYTNIANPIEFIGKTLSSISEDSFSFTDGTKYSFHHFQECCESVRLEYSDGTGDMTVSPIKEFSDSSEEPITHAKYEYYESYTWTTYTIICENGAWRKYYFLGESNGYYGETMYIIKL